MWSDPVVTRYIGGKPSTEQQTWSRLLGYAGHWALMGFGYWAIVEKSSGSFAGELGFANFRRDIAASMRDVPELGWALAARFHGKGYASEAVRAAVAWGDVLRTARTVCLINTGNAHRSGSRKSAVSRCSTARSFRSADAVFGAEGNFSRRVALREVMRVLVTGATGYIGGRLVPR